MVAESPTCASGDISGKYNVKNGAEREIRTPEVTDQQFSRLPPYRAWLSRLKRFNRFHL